MNNLWAGFFNNGDPNSLRRENVSVSTLLLLLLLLLLLCFYVCSTSLLFSVLSSRSHSLAFILVFMCCVVQPPWPRYQATDSQSYYFTTAGSGNRVVGQFNKEMCDFWDTQGYGF